MYYHLPHDKNWDLSGYAVIMENINPVEIMGGFTEKGNPDCYKITMPTINAKNKRGSQSEYVAKSDIAKLHENNLSPDLRANEFFKQWLSDMEDVCKSFCELENIKDVAFWLGTKRGCSRYHVDNVPKRLLVTYAGRGTEWIPDMAADRTAFESGEA